MPSWRAEALRIREGKEKGRRLVRQLERLNELSVAEAVAMTDAFSVLLAEYPDIYPAAPVPLEELKRHAQDLLDADEAVRRTEAEARDATRKLREATRVGIAALREAKRAGKEEDKATIRVLEQQLRRHGAK